MVEPDPWHVIDKNQENTKNCVPTNQPNANLTAFEDNFLATDSEKLPDSKEYIQTLERKLSKLKNTSNILEQLKSRREHCIENLLVGNINLNDCTNGDEIHLNEDIETTRGRDLLRYIQPEQPINLGELVTIIHHDQLEIEQKAINSSDDDDTDGNADQQAK